MDTTTILGYVLFAVSEILPLLPIPTNGLLHSLTIGLKNSLKNSNSDIEVAQNVLHNKPDIANIINNTVSNPILKDTLNNIVNHQELVPLITALNTNTNLQNMVTLLNANPQIINEVQSFIEQQVNLNINRSIILKNYQ